MTTKKRITAVVIASLVIAGFSIGAYQQQNDQVSSGPTWVEFSADVKISRNGRVEWDRIFRAADGSMRTEQVDDRGHTYAVAISSVPDQRLYLWRDGHGWTISPMKIASRPPGSVTPKWVPVAPEATVSKLAGFKLTNVHGIETIVAPALNFYAIESRDPRTGHERVVTSVRVGPQDSTLFRPPDEARKAQIVSLGHLPKSNRKDCKPSGASSKVTASARNANCADALPVSTR